MARLRKPNIKQGFGYVLLILLVVLLFLFDGRFIKSPAGVSIGVLALIIGYFTGLLALAISILFSVYTLIVSLPLLSAAYGFIAYTLARIHYTIATFIFKKILGRTGWYRKTKVKIKNSGVYRRLSRLLDKITLKTGLSNPHMLRVFEVVDCRKCREKIPHNSKYCPYCGVKSSPRT